MTREEFRGLVTAFEIACDPDDQCDLHTVDEARRPLLAAWDAMAAEVALLRAAEQHAAETCRALRAEVAASTPLTLDRMNAMVEEAGPPPREMVVFVPAPADRQPCAAWEKHPPPEDGDDDRVMYSLAPRDGVRFAEVWSHGTAWTACMRSITQAGWVPVGNVFPTLAAAQLAAEDALEAERQELGRMLGKGGA